MTVHLLVATILSRRASCERLLATLSKQTLVSDMMHLVLDGYVDASAPLYSPFFNVVEYRTATPLGPGGRWRVLKFLPQDAILVVLDDDQILLESDVIERLVRFVEHGGAAAGMGTNLGGWGGAHPAGTPLISVGAATMALRVEDVFDLDVTLEEIRSKCNFDPFADGGDDDAVVSAHLWRKGVPMRAAGLLGVATDEQAQVGSQFEKRKAAGGKRSLFWQREEIRRVTGWPWVSVANI